MTGLAVDLQGRPQHIHMQVLDEVNGESVKQFADQFILLYTMVNTDMLNIYNVLCDPDYDYLSQIFDPVTNPDHLDWIHTIISNAKAFLRPLAHPKTLIHFPIYLHLMYLATPARHHFPMADFAGGVNTFWHGSILSCRAMKIKGFTKIFLAFSGQV
jgi:hypothetical protein